MYAALTQATAIGIVHNLCSLVNNNVGVINLITFLLFIIRIACVVSVVNLRLSNQGRVFKGSESFEII